MKHSMVCILSVLTCLCICLTGCNSYQTEPAPATYYHINNEREYQTSIPVAPAVNCAYASQYAVIPASDSVRSSVSTKLCINNTENTVVAAENPFEKIYPASITKIMTALLVLEHGTLTDQVTITDPIELGDPMAVSLELQVGDTLSVNELMHGMLITSANDCAVALGRYVAGDEASFVTMMNDRAAQLGATHTHFVNTNGLHDDDHYTTGYDLYLIYKELITHPEFRAIAELPDYMIHYTDAEGSVREIPIRNSNQFITQTVSTPEGLTVLDGKTGTTNEAGYCLIIEATDTDNQDYIAVICGAGSRSELYTQLQQLLEQTQVDKEGSSAAN